MKPSEQMQIVMGSQYGIVPRKVMKDKEISIEAKGIYAYLASCNQEDTKEQRSEMGKDLNITIKSLREGLEELRKKGYIEEA